MRKGRLRKGIEANIGAPAVIRSGTATSKLNREFGDLFIEPGAGDEFVEPTTDDLKLFASWKKLDRSGDAIGAVKSYRLTPTFVELSESWDLFSCVTGPVACLSGESRIWTENGLERMDVLHQRGEPFRVWSQRPDGTIALESATAPFLKGSEQLLRVELEKGGMFRGAGAHRVLSGWGGWKKLHELPYRACLLTAHTADSFTKWRRVAKIEREGTVEPYYDLTVEATGNYIGEWGVVHHNSGKSTMMNILLMMRCCSQMPCFDGVVRNRALFARGTYEELKTTTMDMWMHLFPQTRIKLSSPIEGCLNFTNNGEQHILTFDAFGFDTNNIENKLRSRAYSIGFFNECQYMLWKAISTALERMGRYPFADMAPPAARAAQRAAEEALDRGDAHNIQGYFLNLGGLADTNSPLADSWLYERAEILRPRNELYLRQPPAMFSLGDARTGWRYEANVGQREGVPRADNVEHLNEGWDYYDNLTRTKSRDEVLRTVCNEYGQISTGDAIFPEFDRGRHLMPLESKPDPALPWVFGVDNGLNPALVAGQFNRKGQLCVYAEDTGDNTSTLKFFREKVIPHMALYNFSVRNPHAMWCDPANMARAAAADDEITSLDQIVSLGFSASSAPVPRNAIRVRINAVKDLLGRNADCGEAAVLFHPVGCKKLIAALAGGYHYKTPKRAGAGVAISLFREPEKNKDADIADAFQYQVCGYFTEGHTSAPYNRGQGGGYDDPVLESFNALYGTAPI